MNDFVMRRFVKRHRKKQNFWNLYRYRAEWGYSLCSGSDAAPGALERFHSDFTVESREHISAVIESLIAEKVAAGYTEITNAPWHGGFKSELRTAFEDALAENPEDLATHKAYADHLHDLGDPRGELIQVQLALEGCDQGFAQW